MTTIAIAGASGFVGLALLPILRRRFDLIALSRSPHRDEPAGPDGGAVTWRVCDLFSLKDAERALEGADYVVHLVHSMMPSARLTQGSFADMDLIVADNVARAARDAGVRHIVYLSGLIPDIPEDKLSAHLASRLEVERTLAASGIPTTTLRAGLILGPGGSSTEMMLSLVRRLPVMACPRWTQTRMQPCALATVVALIDHVIDAPERHGESYDVGAPEALSYREMMQLAAAELGVRRRMLRVPFLSPGLSRLWVSLITGAPRDLVAPLIGSLKHPMVARDRRLQEAAGLPDIPVRDALREAIHGEAPERPRAYQGAPESESDHPTVRSVQRLPRPTDATARWVADAYVRWLPGALAPFLLVQIGADDEVRFHLRGLSRPLLVLYLDPDRSSDDRPLLYIRGGLLARQTTRGRLEFRATTDGSYVLAAIHDYEPRLPWPIYRYTQAPVHLWVMHAFRRWLKRHVKR